MSNKQSGGFDELLLEAIDDSLQILGQEPKLALYQYLSTMQSLDRNDIPKRLETFQLGLKSALGGAAKVVERLILRKLFLKVGSTFKESSEYEFTDHVAEAQRRFEGSRHPAPQKEPGLQQRLKKGQTSS